jgi:hypothetical protein
MLIIFFCFLVFYVYLGTKKQQGYKILEDGAKSIEASLADLSSGLVMVFLHFIMIALIPIFSDNLIIPLLISIALSRFLITKKFAYYLIGSYSRIINKSNRNDSFIYMMKLKAFTIGGFIIVSVFSFYITPKFLGTDSQEVLSLLVFFVMLTIPVIAKAFIPIFEITRYCNRTYEMLTKKEKNKEKG